VPKSGAPSDALWQRFAEAIGIDGTHYDHAANAKSNISLTYAETEMLREVNMKVRKPLGPVEYRLIVNKYLANKLLRRAPEEGKEPDRSRLGAESWARVESRAKEMVEAVAASGVRVIGDLDDLRVAPYQGDPEAGDSSGPQVRIPDSVPQALAKLVLRIARLERDLERSRRLLDGSDAPSAESPRGRKGGGGRKAAGQRRGGKKGGKRAAAAEAGRQQTGDDDDFDDFEATAYDGDHDEGSGDDD
jgi:hypothetical protein